MRMMELCRNAIREQPLVIKKVIDLQEIETKNLIINIDDARVAPAISFVGVY